MYKTAPQVVEAQNKGHQDSTILPLYKGKIPIVNDRAPYSNGSIVNLAGCAAQSIGHAVPESRFVQTPLLDIRPVDRYGVQSMIHRALDLYSPDCHAISCRRPLP